MWTKQCTWRVVSIVILFVAFSAVPGNAQQDRVHILSPSAGTTVRPGQTVTIAVAADASIQKLALMGRHPLGVGQIVAGGIPGVVARGAGESRPVQFQLRIPADIQPGTYHVTAIGTTASGDVESEALTLDVEKAEEPSRIWMEPSMIQFTRLEEQIPVRVLGIFPDASQLDLTRSSKTTYSSADPGVATINADGVVTSVGPGKTSIQARTPTRDYSIPVTVK